MIRADGHYVRAGDDLTLGHGATIHIAHDVYPTIVGNGVTVGSNAVIHACEVQDGCVVEFPYGPSTAFSAVTVPGKAGSSATWKLRTSGNSSWCLGFVSVSHGAMRSSCFLYKEDAANCGSSS